MATPTIQRGTDPDGSSPPMSGSQVYEDRWGATRRIVQLRPHLWRHVAAGLDGGPVLEIGPGLRPTAPVEGSYFVETSGRAVAALARAGGRSVRVGGWVLPFRDGSFDAVMALEVLEHLAEDEALLSEAARVLRPGGLAVISVPLHMALWSATDEACAHVRRYEPDELFDKLSRCGFRIERYHLRPGRCHPVMARVGHGLLFRLPRLSNWWLQNVVFAFQSGWHRRFGRLRWAPVDRPPERDAAGITVVATKPLTR